MRLGRVRRLLFVEVLQLAQAVLSVTTSIATGEVNIVVAPLVCGGRAGDFSSELFQSKVEHLQIEDEIIANFEVGRGLHLHSVAVELQAGGIDRRAKEPRQAWTVDFHSNGAVATNLKLSGTGQLADPDDRILWRLVS